MQALQQFEHQKNDFRHQQTYQGKSHPGRCPFRLFFTFRIFLSIASYEARAASPKSRGLLARERQPSVTSSFSFLWQNQKPSRFSSTYHALFWQPVPDTLRRSVSVRLPTPILDFSGLTPPVLPLSLLLQAAQADAAWCPEYNQPGR